MAVLPLLLLIQSNPDFAGAINRDVAAQECKAVDEDEVIICGQRGRSPYRLPERKHFDPTGDQPSVMRERGALIEEGAVGIHSCGPVGPGGWTGCAFREWERQRQQTAWGSNVRKRPH